MPACKNAEDDIGVREIWLLRYRYLVYDFARLPSSALSFVPKWVL